jgi:uncharacterized protein
MVMAESETEAQLGPVRGRARIDVLDMLRGLAILGILFINVPYMAAPVWQFTSGDVRGIGWSPADQTAWMLAEIFSAGTQRCLLQFLFGAGMMVLARKAMEPGGPVAVADLYYRRNMWLLAFGMVDVFVLLWPGDILHIYALAALFLFPFRRMSPRALLTIGLLWATLFAAGIPDNGIRNYRDRAALEQQVTVAHAELQAGEKLGADETRALARWDVLSHRGNDTETLRHITEEKHAHTGPLLPYMRRAWDQWGIWAQDWLVWDVLEAFCTMLIGVALWKWGVIQGQRSRGFYLGLMLAGYGFGITLRWIGVHEALTFSPIPRILWVGGEFARLAMGLGHLALVNWAVQTRLGNALLTPFKAAGRMAFSLYFLQQFLGMWVIFSPFGICAAWWGHLGWARMSEIAIWMILFELVLANLWFRWFTSGPLEWLWRSLAYLELQPILKPREPKGSLAPAE